MPNDYSDLPRCVNGKLSYPTSVVAEVALAEIIAKRARGVGRLEEPKAEDHTYPCTKCGGHHVSSAEERPEQRAFGRGRRRRPNQRR